MPDIVNQQPKTAAGKAKVPRRLLAIKMRALGDTVLLTGTLRVLQDRYPHWQIDVVVSSNNAPLLENLPFIHKVIVAHEPQAAMARFGYWARLSWNLRKQKYDAVLVFHATNKIGFFGNLIAGSHGLCIVNHHGLRESNRYSHRLVPGRGEVKPNIDRDLDVLRAMGEKVELNEATPELRLTPQEWQEAKAALKDWQQGPLFFLGVGASRDTKRWPPQNVLEFIQLALAKNSQSKFLMCTIENDAPWLEAFDKCLGVLGDQGFAINAKILRLKDQPLRKVMARLAQCQVYVGNDSGLKHIAIGLGVATLTMFGPENPTEWHPYSQERHPYLFMGNDDMPCRVADGKHWCSIPVCVAEGHRCMKNLSAQMAIHEVFRLLETQPIEATERFTLKND